MCRVDLDEAEPGLERRTAAASKASTIASIPASSSGTGAGSPSENGMGLGPTTVQPPSSEVFSLRAALPGQVATGLAARMGELDSRDGPLTLDEPGDPGQRLDVRVVPDPHVART